MELARRIEKAAEFLERDEAMRAMELYQLAQRLRDGRIAEAAARLRFDALRPPPDEVETDGEGDDALQDALQDVS